MRSNTRSSVPDAMFRGNLSSPRLFDVVTASRPMLSYAPPSDKGRQWRAARRGPDESLVGADQAGPYS